MSDAPSHTRSTLDDNQDTIAHVLWAIHPEPRPGELVELRCLHYATGEIQQAWYTDYGALAREALRLTYAGYNAWHGVALRNGRRAGDANVTRTLVIPADADNKLWPGQPNGARLAVEAFTPRPSVAISTGGGVQTYHMLEEPLDLCNTAAGTLYRSLARRLARAMCGADVEPDNISNLERVLRIPGTLNWKYTPARPVRVLWCEPARRYSLAALERWLAEHAPWATLEPAPSQRPNQAGGTASPVIFDFNQRFDALALLAKHGAHVAGQHGHVTHLTRPGKLRGTSGTYGYHNSKLHVFSSGWRPFEAGHAYDAFELFARLEHAGDRRAAYKAARDAGYGIAIPTVGPSILIGNGAATAWRLAGIRKRRGT
jgi:hypothetical protein